MLYQALFYVLDMSLYNACSVLAPFTCNCCLLFSISFTVKVGITLFESLSLSVCVCVCVRVRVFIHIVMLTLL